MEIVAFNRITKTNHIINNSSSQRHTLARWDYMHSISDVIILNNDQHQHKKKQQQQTTGLIQRLNDNIQLLSIGVIVSEKFCLTKCVCLLFTNLSCMKDFLAKQTKGIE